MTRHANTVSIGYLQALLDYAQVQGLAADALLAGHKLDLADREARLTEAQGAELFDRAAALLKDPALGLHVGERIRPGHYGVLGYVTMNCATLAEALQALQRYQRLVIDLGPVELAQSGADIVLTWRPDTERPFRQLAEFNLAGLITFARWISGRAGSPRRIDFNYAAPKDLAEHKRVFGCELKFDQPCYRLHLSADWLGAKLIQPDPEMHALMLRLAEKQMFSLTQGSDDVLAKARGLVAQQLARGGAELPAIAGQLALSPRSLQRRLQESDLSFSALVDEVRRELAERYLADATLELADVAFLLGFSEQSAFNRAFRRWTGKTPQQWRMQQEKK